LVNLVNLVSFVNFGEFGEFGHDLSIGISTLDNSVCKIQLGD
jgi:hypothetical protein